VERGVLSQGKTIQEAQENFKEVVELYLEDQPKPKRQLPRQATWVTTFELEYA
jgi:predicted RNase H-like HicB family nuclease